MVLYCSNKTKDKVEEFAQLMGTTQRHILDMIFKNLTLEDIIRFEEIERKERMANK